MKFLQDILCIFVVLHLSPSYYKSAECTLVIKPENVAVLSGKAVTLRCASDRISKGSIVWKTTNPGSNSKVIIYMNVLTSSVSSYISVDDSGDGNCNLNINASATAAKRYICTESATAVEASAELIVLEHPTMCNRPLPGGSVNVRCFIESTGNWYPVVECEQRNKDGTTVLVGNQSRRSDNNKVTSTLTFTSQKEMYDVICSGKFQQNEKPKETTATNIPEGDFRALGLCPLNGDETNYNNCFDKEFRDLLKWVNELESTALKNQTLLAEIVSQLSALIDKSLGRSSGNLLNASVLRTLNINNRTKRDIRHVIHRVTILICELIQLKIPEQWMPTYIIVKETISFLFEEFDRRLSTTPLLCNPHSNISENSTDNSDQMTSKSVRSTEVFWIPIITVVPTVLAIGLVWYIFGCRGRRRRFAAVTTSPMDSPEREL